MPVYLLAILALVLGSACRGDDSEDEPAPSPPSAPAGGSASGGASASGGRSTTGGTSTGGSAGAAVDCAAVCAQVSALCPGRTDISEIWLDACRTACNARVQLRPDLALLEKTCVESAPTCNDAVACVANPT